MGLFDSAAGLLFGGGPDVNIPNIKRPKDIQYSGLKEAPGEFEALLRERALSQGPSASTLQNAQYAQRGAQSGFNQGVSNLAQSGGASSGSRDRLARQAALQGMQGRQQAFAAGEQQKLGLQNTFANKEGIDRNQRNQFNMDQFKSRLAEYAGAQQGRQQMALAKSQRGQQLFGSLLGAGAALGGGALAGGAFSA